ncbi:MAG: alpha-1,3-galactosidase B, partial [Lentisphaeria bacterium]
MKKQITMVLSLLSVISYAKDYNVSDYGLRANSQDNATVVVNKIIKEIKENKDKNPKIIFAKGDYHFHAIEEMKRELYISNHDQNNPKNVGIAIEEVDNLVIDGRGANFLFHGRMLPLIITNSKNCKIKDISIDFPNPQIAQVSVVGFDEADNSTILEVAPWVKYRIDNGRFITYGDGWENHCRAGIAFDKDTRHIVYNTSDLNTGGVARAVGNNQIKITNELGKRLKKGTIIAMRSWHRPTPGIFLSHSQRTEFNNVKVHYAEGMGLLAQLSEDIILDGFSVCLRGENDPRYFTTQADATHFSSCKGKIIAKNGLYEAMMDDAINVHGTYLKVIKRVNENTLIGRYMHGQAWGFDWGFKADKVQFVKSNTMEIIG